MALHFSGNVSKVFWPSRKSKEAAARAKRLKSLIRLSEQHSLNDRALRNHIEHLDERLDKWTDLSPRPFTGFEWVIYDDTWQEMREQVIATVAVVYDQPNEAVHLLGESFSLPDICSSVLEVQSLVSAALSHYDVQTR